MNVLVFLIPVSLILGFGGLVAFLWTLKNRQYEDLEGDAARILLEDREP
ncbi:cytochrome oxidase maturation protein, cbb3-type [Jannaschia faecimaris]|uniref:Cytochrome oxidase maturation protein, cbb3-type n=1 Tax=Jannaschia faecimaris TaxID=1244108 RepID=A0A1H3U5J8_9RHOB|nr:cbb3-type cytochrome oxidase assembly protein CcoS [Jannaschia faecimaris]SDZ57743.1 cytochrome oxidase maturation protein, cbb3-type [Jannaschia faecimaris]